MATFPRVQSLRGELKRTEIRGGMRFQLTTRELVVQRQGRTYRIALENVIGLSECPNGEFRLHVPSAVSCDGASTGTPYKIVTTLLYLVSPTGVIEQRKVSFYTRLSRPFAAQLEALLRAIPTA